MRNDKEIVERSTRCVLYNGRKAVDGGCPKQTDVMWSLTLELKDSIGALAIVGKV